MLFKNVSKKLSFREPCCFGHNVETISCPDNWVLMSKRYLHQSRSVGILGMGSSDNDGVVILEMSKLYFYKPQFNPAPYHTTRHDLTHA